MKSLKVNPGETFELIITDDKGNEMVKNCYAFDPASKITIQRGNGRFEVEMQLMPQINYQGLFAESKLFSKTKHGNKINSKI